ncbi:MAG: GNAT family N-acetyltransferase [Anaerolineae bacterium]
MLSTRRAIIEVTNNTQDHRFEIHLAEGVIALLDYVLAGENIVYTHTEIPEAYAEQGLDQKLAQAALQFACTHGLRVVPLCPVVVQYLEDHPEYQPLTVGSRDECDQQNRST